MILSQLHLTLGKGKALLDQTLSILLADIAERKSDNIVSLFLQISSLYILIPIQTVILDCCHSSSQTRSHDTIRGIELPEDYTIPVDALDTKEIVRLSKNKVGNKSHVLLASCTRGQTARETPGSWSFHGGTFGLVRKTGRRPLYLSRGDKSFARYTIVSSNSSTL